MRRCETGTVSGDRWGVEDVADQSGRVALVTGANTGIGFAAARVLAERGATVLLGCRSAERAANARQRILEAAPHASVEVVPIDLSDLGAVRTAANQVMADCERLDLLVNNAGIMAVAKGRTVDGFERQVGTNHLGHFALTGHLIDLLAATPGSRVVTVSSLAHRGARWDLDDLMGERRYGRWEQYGRSKLANLLFTYELQRRCQRVGAPTIAAACHPGGSATELARDAGWFTRIGAPLMRLTMQSADAGALPTLRAATDPTVAGGEYFGPAWPGELRGAPKRVASSRASYDEGLARQLWDRSEELTGVRFP
jgi:NAD(P)-dependent dehydrogenase (short-subunit alcohol dehydrogenase family)